MLYNTVSYAGALAIAKEMPSLWEWDYIQIYYSSQSYTVAYLPKWLDIELQIL